ncbi:MAG: beta-methylgalactoside transporter, partial [Oscillospiraceae bacterium]
IAFGCTCIYINSQTGGAQAISTFNQKFLNFVNGGFQITETFKIPYLICYFAIAAIVMWVVWNKTALGKNMFAIGGNKDAAAVSGVNITKNIMGVYIIAGVLYGIAAFLEAGRIQSVNTGTGLNYDLDAISGCVIGGVSFSGGVGTIPGIIIGVVILQFINYSLNFLSVNPYLQYIIKGAIIILAVAIDVRKYIAKK